MVDEREVLFKIGNSDLITLLVDPGSKVNIMSEATFKKIYESSPETIQNLSMTPGIQCSAYGGAELQIVCSFQAWIEVVKAKKPRKYATFLVVRNGDRDLLGYRTGKSMHVARVGLTVNSIADNADQHSIELHAPHLPEIPIVQPKEETKKHFPKIPNLLVKFQLKPDVQPVKSARRNIPLSMQAKVNERLSKMLDLSILERAPKASRWISPMHIVPKSNGESRIVIDMRQPNKAIERQNHPMPLIEEMWDKLEKAKRFTKYDFKDAFHHVEIDEESREVLTFMTDLGLLRFTRLAFGVTCAPELFQKIIEDILADYKDFCIIFLDDILVYAEDEVQLIERQKLVEAKLAMNNLTINEAKTQRNVESVDFLGFTIKEGSITTTVSKTDAIENFEVPKNMKDLRSFLGMVNYLQSFIPNLAEKIHPLRILLRRSNGIAVWGAAQQKAFQNIKDEIANHLLTRKMFNRDRETFIFTDASPHALGSVLVQRTGKIIDNKLEENMIACASKTLTDVESRYSQTQKEALAAVWGIERFYYYLMGRKFTLRTDANALRFIYKTSPKESKRVLNRADGWALRLEPYDFNVEYVKGCLNIADPFSRLYASKQQPQPFENDFEPHVLCYISPERKEAASENVFNEYILAQGTEKCPELKALRKALESGEWNEGLDDYKAFELEMIYTDGIIWRHGLIVPPVSLRHQAIADAHDFHATHTVTQQLLNQAFWWPTMEEDITKFIASCTECMQHGCTRDLAFRAINQQASQLPNDKKAHILLIDSEENVESISTAEVHKSQNEDEETKSILESLKVDSKCPEKFEKTCWKKYWHNLYISNDLLMHREQFVVPKDLRKKIITAAHEGHPGRNTMTAAVARYLWWPEIGRDIEQYVRCCNGCTRTRRPEPPEPIISSDLPTEPWKKISIDFFSAPLDLKSKILVIKDYYTRYLLVKLVKGETAEETIRALESVFDIFGMPAVLKADNGPPFQSKEFSEWCTSSGIALIHSSPLSPRQNGLVERAMQGIKKALSIAKIQKGSYIKALEAYVKSYNSWPHAVTLVPPADLMFGRSVRGKFPISNQAEAIDATDDDIRDRDRMAKMKSKLHQDRVMQAKMRTFSVGDKVYILSKGQTKLCPRFGPEKYTVLDKNGSQLTLQGEAGNVMLRSVEHVTKIITKQDLEASNANKKHQKSRYEDDELILQAAELEKGNAALKRLVIDNENFFFFLIFFSRRRKGGTFESTTKGPSTIRKHSGRQGWRNVTSSLGQEKEARGPLHLLRKRDQSLLADASIRLICFIPFLINCIF